MAEDNSWMDKLSDDFAAKVKTSSKDPSVGTGSKEKLDAESKNDQTSDASILKETSLHGVAQYIMQKPCKNIIVMAGAGISTSAGIPDFRSPGCGLYENLGHYDLPSPQAIFEIDYFHENPQPFFALAKELFPKGTLLPTPSHFFIRMLQEKGLLLRHYTQNIDTLERIAGLPCEKIVEAHGTFHSSHCTNQNCKKEYEFTKMKEMIINGLVPTCEICNSVIKPDIIFFGENLPLRYHQCVKEDFSKCDALIILGTSLVVQPFAGLINKVPPSCPRLLVNREKVGELSFIERLCNVSCGLDFDSPKNTRDVAWLGECDAGCMALADELGFKDELIQLIESEVQVLKEEAKTQTG